MGHIVHCGEVVLTPFLTGEKCRLNLNSIICTSFLCVNGCGFVQATAIFEVLDNLLVDGNMESFEELRDEAGSQRVLDNVERYALYVARVLQEEGENVIINQTGENIGMYNT